MNRVRVNAAGAWPSRPLLALVLALALSVTLAACDTADDRRIAWNRGYQACYAPAFTAARDSTFGATEPREYHRRVAERLAAGEFQYNGWILAIVGMLGLAGGAEGLRRLSRQVRRRGFLTHAARFTCALLVIGSATGCVEISDPMGCAAGARDGRVEGAAAGTRAGVAAGIARANRAASEGRVASIYGRPLGIAALGGAISAVALQAIVLGLVAAGRPASRRVVAFCLPGSEGTPEFQAYDERLRREAEARQARLRAQREAEQQRIEDARAELDAWLGPDVEDFAQSG
jgi:hypothetical protein